MDFGLWYLLPMALIASGLSNKAGVATGAFMAPAMILSPDVTAREAIAGALLVEVFALAANLSQDQRSTAIDQATARKLGVVGAIGAMLGALLVGAGGLGLAKVLVGAAALAVGVFYILYLDEEEEDARIEINLGVVEPSIPTTISTPDGSLYSYSVSRMDELMQAATGGGFATGWFGMGQTATSLYTLIKRGRIPSSITPVTALAITLVTAAAGGLTQFAILVIDGGHYGTLLSILMYAIPGIVLGTLAAPRLPNVLPRELLITVIGWALLVIGCLTIANGLFR